MLPFAGDALPLNPADLDSVAAQLGCDVPAVHAVMTVETGGAGGFLSDGSGRPRILFEAAVFSRMTGHMYDADHPDISSPHPDWRLYRGGAAEYDRLAKACELNRPAALQSASWGMFQVMGENWRMLLYPGVEEMVKAMAHSEGAQLMGFAHYCLRVDGAAAALKARDWDTFARLYNGPLYARNGYAEKLARAYADQMRGAPAGLVRLGASGAEVAKIQTALSAVGFPLRVDGQFGRVTELAVMRFQEKQGDDADGIVGPIVAKQLGIAL